ncbi:SDR family NAD(P)-dependent oxidoreductase [Natronospirillum operosum]|uniref:SDR family NAD(P)-dependent oxidoreductase n=1 Tax=Natronospirillum operosum TaxID=2759953 RepID=A0A4Z0WBC4_9GAMM|nr:SDR family NAD(P)-dependent oxidoreductase [Natronospirillum operosum]
MNNFTAADVPNQDGKTVFITGANTGIGFEAAKELAGKGARVLLGCRNAEKGEAAIANILATYPDADTKLVMLDLSDLSSVSTAAAVVSQEPKLDVLVNNAGIMWNPKAITQDGFESQFGVNHLAHFALTGHLLPKLLATPNSRIVTVSSIGHKLGKGELFLDDIKAEKDYHPRRRYYASKLANLLFTYELDRRLRQKNVSVMAVACHPGMASTELYRYVDGFIGILLQLVVPLLKPFMNSSAQGAWPTLLAATAKDVEGGQYFGPGRRSEGAGPAQQVDSSPASKDLEKAKRLWDFSIEMTGVDPGV